MTSWQRLKEDREKILDQVARLSVRQVLYPTLDHRGPRARMRAAEDVYRSTVLPHLLALDELTTLTFREHGSDHDQLAVSTLLSEGIRNSLDDLVHLDDRLGSGDLEPHDFAEAARVIAELQKYAISALRWGDTMLIPRLTSLLDDHEVEAFVDAVTAYEHVLAGPR